MRARPDLDGRAKLKAVLTTHYWHPHTGGIETVSAHHREELTNRGWRIDVHTSRIPRSSPTVVCEARGVVRRHRALNVLERRLGVPVPIPAPGLRRSIQRTAVASDLIIAHGHVYPVSVAAMRAADRLGKPFVLVQHSPWIDYPAPLAAVEWSADHAVGRRVLRRAELVICVSRFTESYVLGLEPGARTTVVHNGVDTERFRPSSAVGAQPRREFLCVRRLVPRNGVDVLLDAWVRAGLQEWTLVIIGDGVDRERLQARTHDQPNVRFEGFVPIDQLVVRLQGAYASIVPTRSGEGFGLAAAEAHACRIPVIAAAQGALPEVVTDQVNGLHFTPGDSADLAAKIVRLAGDPGLRQRLAEAAAERDWTWRRVGDELDQVLRSVLDDHR